MAFLRVVDAWGMLIPDEVDATKKYREYGAKVLVIAALKLQCDCQGRAGRRSWSSPARVPACLPALSMFDGLHVALHTLLESS